MKCLRCNSEDMPNRYCSHCGKDLYPDDYMKCPECGGAEKIGRPICYTKANQAQERVWQQTRKAYRETGDKMADYGLFFPFYAFMAIVFLETVEHNLSGWSKEFCFGTGVTAWIIIFTVCRILHIRLDRNKAVDEAERAYLAANPEDADLLRKHSEWLESQH